MLSSSILFSGAVPEHALCNNYQWNLLQPPAIIVIASNTLNLEWLPIQLLQQLQALDKPLMIDGDGRADSPGHSAKYGSYTRYQN